MKRYPIGIQTFREVITGDYYYVDKTDIIYNLVNSFKYTFLSRPRRFGKSLLLSTLQSYFEGRSDLFQGLAIEKLETDWVKHPVLRFDFSTVKMFDEDTLKQVISDKLYEYETIWGKFSNSELISSRFESLIKQAYNQTGQKVVVLIDEYDAPFLNAIDDLEKLDFHRGMMRNFYAILKNCDAYIRFVFITGITKFSQLSLFSELNNLVNISMLPDFSAICGVTQEEVLAYFTDGINQLAQAEKISFEQAVDLLKENYDGYHFTYPSADIYNPYSLLNSLSTSIISNYWFASGGTSLAIYALQKNNITPEQLIGDFETSIEEFDKPFERSDDVMPLLYQSGYLTIKDYDKAFQQYTLALPNREVKMSLLKTLMPYYIRKDYSNLNFVAKIAKGLREDDLDLVFNTIKKVFASVSQCDNTNYEGHYQSMLCIIFVLVGQFVEAETRTSNGRVDIVINNKSKVYLIEIKLNKSAEGAIEQIENKEYAQKFLLLGLPIVKVGLSFNTDTRNIEEWKVCNLL